MIVTEIQNRIQNAKNLDFGDIFNKAIELFKKVWVQGLVTLLLNMVLAIPLVMIVYIPLIMTGVMSSFQQYDTYDAYGAYDPYAQPEISPILMLVIIVLYIFMIVVMSAISLGLKAAFYRICKLKDTEQMGKEDYFYFLKKQYLKKTIVISLVITGISILATLLCFFPIFYVIVPISFMAVVYAFNPELSVSEIVKLSFELGNKKWLITFGLIIVAGFLASIVGMLMCFIGVYVTASFANLPVYHIYKDVVGFDGESETPRIEQNSTF